VTRIAIIGGGIGGLTAALTLRQFGFEPEVFEQAPELLEVGAAIAVWPNAMRILNRLGIGEEIMRRAGTIEQVRWLDSKGKLLNSTRFPKTDTPAVALHRADLQNVLLRALPSSSIHLGKVFQSFAEESNEVHARFVDGPSVRCDLLIGGDGLHSHVRAQLLDDSLPVFRGYTVWRGTTATVPPGLSPATAIEIHGSGKRFGIGPVGMNKIGWWASANAALGPTDHVESHVPDQVRELLTLFAGWYTPVLELIAGTPGASIVKTAAFDRPPTRKWGQGRATLLGDAVHPTTPNLGQGGCMAIEDAAILARCLHKHGAGVYGLRAYEKLRYARTKAVAGYSRIYGSVGQWENPWATRLRGAALSLVPQAITRRLLQLVFDYDAYRVSV
jgi:2-polyprenyl-6-methoxyphenol hydroxylase-like FAD-dependent oxidoreductase